MYSPPRKSEFFLVTLMVLTSVAIVYGIYHFNPYFMNRKPLSESLSENQNKSLTIPESSMEPEGLGPWDFLEQKNISRTFINDSQFQMGTTYVRESTKKLIYEVVDNDSPPKWSVDEDGFYFVYPKELVKTNLNNEQLWFFKIQEDDQLLFSPVVGSKYLFAISKKGYLYKLNKETGELSWLLKVRGELVQNILPYNSFLFFVTSEGNEDFFIYKLNGHTGEQVWKNKLIGLTKPSPLTINESLKLIMLTDPNGSLLCLDFNSGNAYWQKKKLGTISFPANTFGESAVISNDEGKAISINLKKKSINWEYELPSKATSNFAYIPSHGIVAVLTENGYLQTIEARTGEGHWRYNTRNEQQNSDVFSIRFNNRAIAKYSLNWSHKGWTIISPCSSDRLCIFNPEKGQLVNRLQLRGTLTQYIPHFYNDKLYALLKAPQRLPWSQSSEPMPNFAVGIYKVYSPSERTQTKSSPEQSDDSEESEE
ncbi:MAG: PQQ-binding-like beta-propeller repeat protein [Bdellovibrionales bacterium]|nr:PQQ-binding-like beta-propeller repeat protein [Bdellovibrionales bacterium]